MTIKYNYLFIYNEPSVWQTWKYFSKQQLPTNDATSLLCCCHHLHHHNTQTCQQFCHHLYGASTYIFAKYSRSCKYFLVEKSDHRGRCSALGSGLCSCLCWLSLAQLRRCTSGQESRVSEPALFAESSCAQQQGDCPQPGKCRLRNISTRHRHLRFSGPLGNKQGPPAPSILMRIEIETSKCCTPYINAKL